MKLLHPFLHDQYFLNIKVDAYNEIHRYRWFANFAVILLNRNLK